MRQLLANYIDKYGQYFVLYQKFRKLVPASPLMPDKEALAKIKVLEAEEKAASALL